MSKVETTKPEAPSAETPRTPEKAIDCASAAILVRRFLAGDEAVEQRGEMRAHLASCETCRTEYRSSVETIARLARVPRSDERRAHGRFFSSTTGPRRKRGVGMVFLPIAAIACVYWMSRRGPADSTVELKVIEGHVQVGETVLDASSSRLELKGSQGGRTEAGARARIEAGTTSVEIEPSTAFSTERVNPLRMRLFEGRMSIAGTLAVTTHIGVLELTDGRAHVTLDERGLTLESTSGKLIYADRTGVQEVAPGELLWVPATTTGAR